MQKFTVSGYKGVREIELIPNGALTIIAGDNGAGKSSFIDAITELIDPRGVKLTPKPIREGETQARAEFEDDELGIRLTRVWTKDGSAGTLTAENLDGARYQRPAEMVAKLTGGSIFDPVSWLALDEKKQLEELLSKVELPFDLDTLAANKKQAENDRLEAGREVKRLKSVVESLPNHGGDVPLEEVSSREVIDKINLIQGGLDDIRDANTDIREANEEISRVNAEIRRLTERLAAAERKRGVAIKFLDSIEGDPQAELEAAKGQLNDLEAINQRVREKATRRVQNDALIAAAFDYAAAKNRIDAIELVKRKGLEEAEFPIPGLSVDEDGITYDGIPFGQVNSAHRTRVAFAIATAGDPDLKLTIIKNGDLLDANSIEALQQMADERGYTVLVERDRDASRDMGFVIRDGELAN